MYGPLILILNFIFRAALDQSDACLCVFSDSDALNEAQRTRLPEHRDQWHTLGKQLHIL
jgi:hypothetical protein